MKKYELKGQCITIPKLKGIDEYEMYLLNKLFTICLIEDSTTFHIITLELHLYSNVNGIIFKEKNSKFFFVVSFKKYRFCVDKVNNTVTVY